MSSDATTWSAIQSFPAADGSRTLRVTVPFDAIDALHALEACGLRQTYVRAPRSTGERLMSKSEISPASGKWLVLQNWFSATGRRRATLSDRLPARLPAVVYEDLRCGKLRSVKQKMTPDARRSNGIRVTVEVERENGTREALEDYLRAEASDVEMCVPLSRDEAKAIFHTRQLMGVRHTYTTDQETGNPSHQVEVTRTGDCWEVLSSNKVLVWDSVISPHFRLTYANKLSTNNRTRQVVHSENPWADNDPPEGEDDDQDNADEAAGGGGSYQHN